MTQRPDDQTSLPWTRLTAGTSQQRVPCTRTIRSAPRCQVQTTEWRPVWKEPQRWIHSIRFFLVSKVWTIFQVFLLQLSFQNFVPIFYFWFEQCSVFWSETIGSVFDFVRTFCRVRFCSNILSCSNVILQMAWAVFHVVLDPPLCSITKTYKLSGTTCHQGNLSFIFGLKRVFNVIQFQKIRTSCDWTENFFLQHFFELRASKAFPDSTKGFDAFLFPPWLLGDKYLRFVSNCLLNPYFTDRIIDLNFHRLIQFLYLGQNVDVAYKNLWFAMAARIARRSAMSQ